MKEKLIRVAVYGTLMTGERNEHWGADARRRVPCTIRGVLYDTGWGYPAFVPDEHGRDVAAELLDVTPDPMARPIPSADETAGFVAGRWVKPA